MIESVEQTTGLVEPAPATDRLGRDWQALYYVATYLRGRGDNYFADDVWQELESAQEEGEPPPPQTVHRLRAHLEQRLYGRWQALYDGATMLKRAGYDPFSTSGWEDLLAAKDAKDLDALALTIHYLQPSVTRTQSQVIQELIQVVRLLQDQEDDPLSPEEWESLLAPEKTPQEEETLIQSLMPRVTDTLHIWLQKLNLTAQRFLAAGYTPFISDWKQLQQALERRTLRDLAAAIRIFPDELKEHIRLRLPYWSAKVIQMEQLQDQLEIQKNRTEARDLIATYETGLAKLKSLDRKGSYSLDSLNAMVLAISEVESSWRKLVALSQSETRLAKVLNWAIGGIIVVFLALIVVVTAVTPQLTEENEPIPLLGIPLSVILWSFIGSFVALLTRFVRRKFWEISDFVKWFLTRALVGFVMGAVLYLVVVSGFFAFGIVIGSPSEVLGTLPRPEIFWLLTFIVAANDSITDRVLRLATGRSIGFFAPSSKPATEAVSEPTNESEEGTGSD